MHSYFLVSGFFCWTLAAYAAFLHCCFFQVYTFWNAANTGMSGNVKTIKVSLGNKNFHIAVQKVQKKEEKWT